MAKKAFSTRDMVMLLFLAVLLVGVFYYMFYYQPLQKELASISIQCSQTDSSIQVAQARVNSMDGMQAELDEILSRPDSEITEIAPYDNAKVVMSQLNGILSASDEYSLHFEDPVFDKTTGMVRRSVSLDFSCGNYESAKSIINALSASRWRCQITKITLAVSGYATRTEIQQDEEGNDVKVEVYDGIMTSPVKVRASILFFESTEIQ